MRLFWKLFCSVVIITVLGSAVIGFVLIHGQFRAGLDREAASVYQENDLLRYALAVRLANSSFSEPEDLAGVAADLGSTGGQRVAFRLSRQDGTTLASGGVLPMAAAPLLAHLDAHCRGWELTRAAGNWYLHAASPLTLFAQTVYLENCREVSDLFADRAAQYRSFLILMPALATAAALSALLVAALMLSPLRRLSRAARRMAAGELDQRVRVTGDDELGRLSADFNAMAGRLEAQVTELIDMNRRQEDFIGSFTHELKTPLTSIIGYAELLLSQAGTEEVLESAGYIFREGRRLEALSRKLLDIIVLEQQEPARKPVAMDAFLRRVGGALQPTMKQANIRLKVRAQAATVAIDTDLMEAVCLNLLDNARKAVDGGLISLTGTVTPDGYCIEVADNGKGIPPEDLSRVTEAFYMVDKSRARAQGGAGLGLALCRRIVTLHDGTLRIESTLGKGTRVTILLPGGGTP